MVDGRSEIEGLEAGQFSRPVSIEGEKTLTPEIDRDLSERSSKEPEFVYSPEDLRRLSVRDDLIDWAEAYNNSDADESLRRNLLAEMIGKLEADHREVQDGSDNQPLFSEDEEHEQFQSKLIRLANDYQSALKCVVAVSEGEVSPAEKQLALALTLAAGGVHNPDNESRLPEGLKLKIVSKESLPEGSQDKLIVEVNGEFLVSEEALGTQKSNERLVDNIEVALGWKEEDQKLSFDPEPEGGFEETDPRFEWQKKVEEYGGTLRDLKLFYRYKGNPAAFVLAKFIVDLSENKSQFDVLNSLDPGSTEWALAVAWREFRKTKTDAEAKLAIPSELISKRVFGEYIARSRELYVKIAEGFAEIDLEEFFAADEEEELSILDADAGTDSSGASGEEETKAPETKKQGEGGKSGTKGDRANRWKVPTLGESIRDLYSGTKDLAKALHGDMISGLDLPSAIIGNKAA